MQQHLLNLAAAHQDHIHWLGAAWSPVMAERTPFDHPPHARTGGHLVAAPQSLRSTLRKRVPPVRSQRPVVPAHPTEQGGLSTMQTPLQSVDS